MTDLCNCPFCGSAPRVYQTEFRIMCSDQHCAVRPSVYSNDLDTGVARWNSRPETEEEKAAREAENAKNLEQALQKLVDTVTGEVAADVD